MKTKHLVALTLLSVALSVPLFAQQASKTPSRNAKKETVQPAPQKGKPAVSQDPNANAPLPKEKGSWYDAYIDDDWYIHYDKAMEKAKKEGKFLLIINFDRNDTKACDEMRKEVFKTQDFRIMVKRSFIVLYLEHPANRHLKEDQNLHNAKVRAMIGFSNIYPSVTIVNPSGKVFGTIDGFLEKKKFMKELEKFEAPKSKTSRSYPLPPRPAPLKN